MNVINLPCWPVYNERLYDTLQWNLSIKDTLNKDFSLMRTLSAVPTT